MSNRRRLHPVPFDQVAIHDPFWSPRLEINRKKTLPAIYRKLKKTGRIDAFGKGYRPGAPHRPHIFWDSDVAKWIEGASYALALYPDKRWARILESVVEKILAAQQPDGYLNIFFTAVEPEKRWTNLRDSHELYCAGHLMEAAVAYHQATGSRAFLDAMGRYAETIGRIFGPKAGQKRGYPGHPEIELALIRLYRATGEERHLELSEYFINERGRKPHYFDQEARRRGEDPGDFRYGSYAYNQSHLPVREQKHAVGHAVRAFYLYSAMADLCRERGDLSLRAPLKRLWASACTRRLYLTGGAGSSRLNEGFTRDYDLPEESAYAETCAAVALVFWNHRMLQFAGESRFADLMERALYNGAPAGVSLEGDRFFYVNPMARGGQDSRGAGTLWDGAAYGRQDWFGCACCPTNLARLLASLGGMIYSVSPVGAWIHLYIGSTVSLRVRGLSVTVRQEGNYPWTGKIRITVDPEAPFEFTLYLRIPGWCREARLKVAGKPKHLFDASREGYVRIRRTWKPGDRVELDLSLPVETIHAHPKVKDARGKAALQRGPIVYCVEEADNPGIPLDRMVLEAGAPLKTVFKKDLLGGVTVVKGRGRIPVEAGWKDTLYRSRPAKSRHRTFMAVPYCVWANRGPGAMRIWLRFP